MKTIDFSHFIERYIAGEMGEDEKQWFGKELESNENLRKEVDLRKKTDLVLKNQNIITLRNKLADIEKRRKEANVAVSKTSRPVYLRYAAVITALAVIGSLILLTGKNSGNDEVISRVYKSYEPPASQRSGQSVENADFTLALEFYNTNDYENAALFFSKVVESNPKDMQSMLLKGVSNFEDQKYPEAKISFATVIDDNNNLFIETARWYLALCYIKTNEKDKAISQLQSITDDNGIYSKDARKILRKTKISVYKQQDMFDLTVTDNHGGENSRMTKCDTGIVKDSLKNIVINCPSIITGMSHEMRTYMNAIVAFSYLMKDSCCSNTDREEFSNQILSSCEQLIGLFDSFLDSAIIDMGNSKTDSKICKLNNMLDDLLSEFREIIKKEGHKDLELISVTQDSDLTEVFLDKHRVFRVIRSLFQIAVKNTKSGYIKVGYHFRDDYLTFYILDSGQGYFKCKEFLHTEDLNESLVQHNDMYTAINLTLARKLIHMLGGTIWIECNGITGSAINFSVPARVVESTDIKINKYINTVIAI